MKEYNWIKQESDAEAYLINGTYYKVVWGFSTGNETGPHNVLDTEVCVYKWTGEDCTVDELPGAMDSDWEAIEGFDLKIDEDGETDWEDYGKQVDRILSEIEEEQTQ